MKFLHWERLKKMRGLLVTGRPEPAQQAERIVAMQRDVVLPSKAGICVVVLGYLFFSRWLEEPSTQSVVLDTLKRFFEIYLACTLLGALFFGFWRRRASRPLSSEVFQWVAFMLGLLDGLFMAGMIVVTGGFDSIAFWVFPALVILNALSIPLAVPQIVLNLTLSALYMAAVALTPALNTAQTVNVPGRSMILYHGTNQTARLAGGLTARPNRINRPASPEDDNPPETISPQQLLSRVSVLWLLTLCCYGAQVLSERQRQAAYEAGEFAAREGQLHSAGRLAAEFAHQIKNPLTVINNAAYSLGRSLGQPGSAAAQQVEIIQEEVARADKVITQIMGYAQLSEGRVEKLNVVGEIERATEQVFPPAVPAGVILTKIIEGPFPPVLMQRGHLEGILVNLLLNAREALGERGNVVITAGYDRDRAVEFTVADDGPGIAPDKLGRIFEAYFTTKEKGTGLGLAIVKHNAELYGGVVRVESVLGKGSKFTVTLPVKLMRNAK